MIRIFWTLVLLLFFLSGFSQTLQINEILANNNMLVMDRDGDDPDCLELYNSSKREIHTKGYYLTDNRNCPDKWALPELRLEPGGFLTIFASGKNRFNEELHTNFKIKSSGEKLFLIYQDEILDSFPTVSLDENESYGRCPDGSEHMIVMSRPSIGRPNDCTSESIEVCFSKTSGFYQAAFSLELLCDRDTAEMFYTLDGTDPDTASIPYSCPVWVEADKGLDSVGIDDIPTSYSWEKPLEESYKGVVIKAAAFYDGKRISDVIASTYFTCKSSINRYRVPLVSIICDPDNLFQQDTGIYIAGAHLDPENPEWTGNCAMRGKEWERKVFIQYFDAFGSCCLSQNTGLRIHGGVTRSLPQKSMRLYARDEYGQNEFNYPFFGRNHPDTYRRLILRTSMSSWRDAVFEDLLAGLMVDNLNIDKQAKDVVVVFVNGVYWGVFTLCEYLDENYLASHYSLEKDKLDIVQRVGLVKEGDDADLEDVLIFAMNNNLATNAFYDEVSERIDLENFIDYMISELYFNNYDWPKNNVLLWKEKAEHAKWRWAFFDLDAGMHCADCDLMDEVLKMDLAHPMHSILLFKELMDNEGFKSRFYQRALHVVQNDFAPEKAEGLINWLENMYSPLIAEQINRWRFPESLSSFRKELDDLRQFFRKRPKIFKEQLQDTFNKHLMHYLEDVFLYPNPAQDHVNIAFGDQVLTDIKICIYNAFGAVVLERSLSSFDAPEIRMDLSGLPKGIYILSVVSSYPVLSKKFVIL